MKFLDNLENAGKMNYSIDIQKAINSGSINKAKFYTYISRMLDGDFGKLDTETGYRFLKSIEKGDRDIYGIYDNIVVYYDAAQDSVDIVTSAEFTRYFKADWQNANREDKEARLSTLHPDRQWKEGQRREIIKEVSSVVPEGQQQRALRMGSDGKGVYPYMDYSKIVKTLGPERMAKFKELSEKYNIPIKKFLASFTHQHSVQNLNVQNAFEYVVKHAGDKYFAATDSKESEVDLQFLIDDEFEAIAGYKEMIAKTKNPALLSILTHILQEETEHVEELRAAQAGKYENAKIADNEISFEKFPKDKVVLKYYQSEEIPGDYHIIAGTSKFYEVFENFNPRTGKYSARYENFKTLGEAQSFLNKLL